MCLHVSNGFWRRISYCWACSTVALSTCSVLILLTHLLLLMTNPPWSGSFSACTQCVFDAIAICFIIFIPFLSVLCGNCNRHFPFPSLSNTHFALFSFCYVFFVAIIVSFDLFSVSSDFRWHSTLFCLLFGFGRVVLATLQRPCCANICHLTLVSLLVSVSFTALLFSLLLLFSFSSLSFWWGLWFSGSAFDLRCLIAGVVCGLQPWSIVNAFAHAAHKFLATFYVFFVLFFLFFWGYPTLSFPARNWKQRGVAVAETPTVAFEFWKFCIALRGSISAVLAQIDGLGSMSNYYWRNALAIARDRQGAID